MASTGPDRSANDAYRPLARALHWLTVLLLALQVPVGMVMAWRGNVLNVWDTATNTMYSGHKLAGIVILLVVAWRLAYRFTRGAPPDEPTIEPWQRLASHATHWMLYLLLLCVPVAGWIGVSLFPALDVFGWFRLPALAAPDKAAAQTVLAIHGWLALLLVAVAGMHVAAALFHHLVRRDGVLARMLPGLRRGR